VTSDALLSEGVAVATIATAPVMPATTVSAPPTATTHSQVGLAAAAPAVASASAVLAG
jgi:hypothetical protein